MLFLELFDHRKKWSVQIGCCRLENLCYHYFWFIDDLYLYYEIHIKKETRFLLYRYRSYYSHYFEAIWYVNAFSVIFLFDHLYLFCFVELMYYLPQINWVQMNWNSSFAFIIIECFYAYVAFFLLPTQKLQTLYWKKMCCLCKSEFFVLIQSH